MMAARKGAVQQLGVLGKTPSNETAADPGIPCATPFSLDPVAVAVAAAEQA